MSVKSGKKGSTWKELSTKSVLAYFGAAMKSFFDQKCMLWFFACRDGIWYYVEIGKYY